VWHESGQYLNNGGQDGQDIEVKDGDNFNDFKLKAK
jgi:hypothetical protein